MIKWYKKISTKIICILFLTILITSPGLGIISFHSEKKIALGKMEKHADQTFYRVKARLEEYIPLNRAWIIEKLIDIELESNSELIGIVLEVDSFNSSIGRVKTKGGFIADYNPADSQLQKASTYTQKGKLGQGGKTAALTLYFTNKSLVDRLFMFVVRSVLLTFILSVAIGIILFLSLRKMIITPIYILNNVVEMVIKQDFDTMAPVMARDEIGNLADSLNLMTVKLRANMRKIREINESLEAKVSERTRELDEANSMLTKANHKMKNELKMAKKVQMSIIPTVFPTLGMLDVYGSYVPMDDIGGDFYDVYQISSTKVAFVIADVCGHGIPSALITSMAKVSFANNSKEKRRAGDILKAVNDELYLNLGESGYYMTAFYCIIDKTTRKFEYSSAGHPDIFILRENQVPLVLESNSVFLGFFEDAVYETAFEYLQKGDRIVLYTDGLTEVKDDRDCFYEKRFYESLVSKRHLSPKEYVDLQIRTVKQFYGNEIYKDDITLLVIDFTMDDYEVYLDLHKEYEFIDNTGVTSQFKLQFIGFNNLLVKALENVEKADYETALELLVQLEDNFYKQQDNFNVLKMLGFTCYKLDQYTRAIYYWEKAISLNPDAEELVVNIGRLWENAEGV